MSCDVTQIIYPGYDIQTSGWMKTQSENFITSGQFVPFFNLQHIEVLLPFAGGFQFRRENNNLNQLQLSVNSGLYYPDDNSYIEYNPAVFGVSTTSGCILTMPFSGINNGPSIIRMQPTYANVRFRAFMPESSYLTLNNSAGFARCSLSFNAVDGDIFNVFTDVSQAINPNGSYTDYNVEFPLISGNYGREVSGIVSCNLAFYGASGNGFRISEIDLIMSGLPSSQYINLYRNIDEGTLGYSDFDYIYNSGESFAQPSSAMQYIAFSGGIGNFSPTEVTTYPQKVKLRMRAQRRLDKDGGNTPVSVKWYVTDNQGRRFDRAEHTWDMFYPLNSSVGTFGDYEFSKRAIMPSGADLTGAQIHMWVSGYPLHQNVSGVVISAMEVFFSGCHLENFCAAPIADDQSQFQLTWISGSPYLKTDTYHPTSGLFRNIDDFYQKEMHDIVGSGGTYSYADNDYVFSNQKESFRLELPLGRSTVLPTSGTVYASIFRENADNLFVFASIRSETQQILQMKDYYYQLPGPVGAIQHLILPVVPDNLPVPPGGHDLSNITLIFQIYSGIIGESSIENPYANVAKIYALECCISGTPIASNVIATGLPLYISGHNATGIFNTFPLYVSGSPAQGNNSGYFDLFVEGGFSNGLDLFVLGGNPISSGLDLYISGSPFEASIPLYLHGPVVNSGYNSLPFISYGSNPGTTGFFDSIPFYIKGTGPEGALPLYLAGASTVNESAILPLFAYGAGFNVASGIDLFIQNNYIDSGIPLYIRGRGITNNPDPLASGDGTILDASIPLFINRVNEVEVLPLYLHNNQASDDLPFYVMGAYSLNSGINLVIPNITASSIKHLPLYVHGF